MTIQEIEKFLANSAAAKINYVKISFKKRNEVLGLFVHDRDFDHLKSKNFWRIVTKGHLNEFKNTGDLALARIFNGSEFSRIALYEGPL
jgi:hypothetical protein